MGPDCTLWWQKSTTAACHLRICPGSAALSSECWVSAVRSVSSVVAALDIDAIPVRSDRRVLQANRAAEALLRRQRWLTVVDGKLRTTHPGSQRMLARQIAAAVSAASGAGIDSGGIVRLDHAGRVPLSILALPLRVASDNFGPSQPTALLLFRDPDAGVAAPPAALGKTYGPSDAESRLVALLVEGNSLTQAAGLAGVSLNTARTQLRSVFARTGFSRQTDLVAEIRGNNLLHIHARRDVTGSEGNKSSTAPTG